MFLGPTSLSTTSLVRGGVVGRRSTFELDVMKGVAKASESYKGCELPC